MISSSEQGKEVLKNLNLVPIHSVVTSHEESLL